MGKRAEGSQVIFEGEGGASAPTVTASVSRLPEFGLWDRWDALVRLGRGHEARQTGALVRSLRVGALPVLTQGHLVADVLTLVDVCRRRTHDELVGTCAETAACSTSAAERRENGMLKSFRL